MSELYCKNNENARNDSEVAEEMKRGSFGVNVI